MPYKYEKVLSSAPFMINTLYVYDLIDPNQFIDFDTLAILSKISSDGFLLKHRVIGNDNSFKVQALNGGKNYTNDLDTDLRSALLEIDFTIYLKRYKLLFHQIQMLSISLGTTLQILL